MTRWDCWCGAPLRWREPPRHEASKLHARGLALRAHVQTGDAWIPDNFARSLRELGAGDRVLGSAWDDGGGGFFLGLATAGHVVTLLGAEFGTRHVSGYRWDVARLHFEDGLAAATRAGIVVRALRDPEFYDYVRSVRALGTRLGVWILRGPT